MTLTDLCIVSWVNAFLGYIFGIYGFPVVFLGYLVGATAGFWVARKVIASHLRNKLEENQVAKALINSASEDYIL